MYWWVEAVFLQLTPFSHLLWLLVSVTPLFKEGNQKPLLKRALLFCHLWNCQWPKSPSCAMVDTYIKEVYTLKGLAAASNTALFPWSHPQLGVGLWTSEEGKSTFINFRYSRPRILYNWCSSSNGNLYWLFLSPILHMNTRGRARAAAQC